MDLDELKHQLKNKLAADHSGRSDSDIAALLQNKTRSAVSKLQKSLWIEIIFCVVGFGVFAYIGLTNSSVIFRTYFAIFTILFVVIVPVLVYLLKRTRSLSNTVLPVKSNLQIIVNLMEELIKRYFQLTMAMIPISLIVCFLLIYQNPSVLDNGPKYGEGFFKSQSYLIAFLVGYVILLTVVVYYTTKWYLRKLYGRYVVQLKECIAELEEEEIS